ncbi:hypothetical protein HW450_06630 [Corynebacterium hindlerae]|uniref:Secreted protein n=1 Tax=Corynebacterium hindlerae TaxID=699041 RepID=A0A7G5FIC4_9CORY|nr:hypothetical protein [Corynebacterium hindlerae]QMV86365.1 hypothetical protein HW450_06630 [Corynebacterium hindlerae]
MKRILVITALAFAGATLTACGALNPTEGLTSGTVQLQDGRHVECVIVRADGGLSCDWGNAK